MFPAILKTRCWNCKDNLCHVGEKRKLAFVHLPPKQLGDSTVCIWQQFVAAPLLFKLALRRNLAYEISSLPYSRVLDYSTFEFTTLPYPTRSWKTSTRRGLPTGPSGHNFTTWNLKVGQCWWLSGVDDCPVLMIVWCWWLSGGDDWCWWLSCEKWTCWWWMLMVVRIDGGHVLMAVLVMDVC